jgi:23S rRNA (cytosine1962-C5)-methyltransferase
MFVADKWKDLEVLYAGDAEKLERWGDVYLRRPDPQAIWPMDPNDERPHAVYQRSSTGGGSWERRKPMPNSWKISYDSLGKTLNFIIEPTSFKHTGLFPEQAANWDWFGNIIENAVKEGRDDIKILNLFAYTGGATCAAACHGAAETVHVDASKGMIQRAKENIEASGLGDKYVRFIAEDCRRFVEREIRRGRKYDGIIMDPPKYGRGPTGELWEIDKSLYEFVDRCSLLLSDKPLFFLISSYATELGPSCAGNVLKKVVGTRFGGKVDCDELGLPISRMGFDLPCGQSARWSRK